MQRRMEGLYQLKQPEAWLDVSCSRDLHGKPAQTRQPVPLHAQQLP